MHWRVHGGTGGNGRAREGTVPCVPCEGGIGRVCEGTMAPNSGMLLLLLDSNCVPGPTASCHRHSNASVALPLSCSEQCHHVGVNECGAERLENWIAESIGDDVWEGQFEPLRLVSIVWMDRWFLLPHTKG